MLHLKIIARFFVYFMNPAAVFGDPHFYTFDNLTYTFNGKGEFVLVRADTMRHKIDVQGRFEAVPNNIYGTSRATMLTSVAGKTTRQLSF